MFIFYNFPEKLSFFLFIFLSVSQWSFINIVVRMLLVPWPFNMIPSASFADNICSWTLR